MLKITFNQSSSLVFSIAFATIALTQNQAVSQPTFFPSNSLKLAQSSSQGTGTTPTTDAGSRNPCMKISKQLILLIGGQSSYTTEAHPTFWFYVPYEQKLIDSAEISLRQPGKKTIDIPVDLKKSPGFSNFTMPKKYSINQEEQYEVVLIVKASCDENSSPISDATSIQVVRKGLEPRLKAQIEQAKTPEDRIRLLAKNGFWIDAFALSAIQNPKLSSRETWKELLKAAGLESMVDGNTRP
jgi:hypothetical protein